MAAPATAKMATAPMPIAISLALLGVGVIAYSCFSPKKELSEA